MVRVSKSMCRLWLARLEEAEKDETQGARIYAQYANESPFVADQQFFAQAAKDEARHRERIHMSLLYLRDRCED